MMGSLKALQEWCRIQCEDYNDVEIKNMSTSFRDGLAFCAIIHRYRPDLIDFSSLSKENVYENNKLAFEVAETQLGIPALLDPEDMVSMSVPDRLSIITYVSQYYNFFTNKSHANPPCMKRPGGTAQSEPAQKRPVVPLEDGVAEPGPDQTGMEAEAPVRHSTLSSTCAACQKHVHLVQRFLVDGKLYHRNCFRCRECCSTLLPGSYKLGNDSGSLVCTHHFTRSALTNQNGRPDLTDRPAGFDRVMPQQSPPSEREQAKTPPPSDIKVDPSTAINDSLTTTPVAINQTDPLEQENEKNDSREQQEEPPPSTPSNPFDDGDEEEVCREEEEPQTAAKETPNGNLPATPATQVGGATFPVPAPRRIPERTPPPRPAPRVHSQRRAPDAGTLNSERPKPVLPPKPRSRSPGSLSSGTPKPKDPPWLALVQSEPRKKPAPPPPPAGLATPPHTGSLSSLKGESSRPSTPPPPANPFEDEDEEGGEEEGAVAPAVPAASHPWYRITQAAEGAAGMDAPPSGGSSPRTASPEGTKSKKRPAPRVPRPPSSSQALSMESLSSGSDHSASQAPLGGGGSSSSSQEPPFTKSVSEPSISRPSGSASSLCSSSTERLSHLSLNPSPAPVPPNASSAPATPQTNRSAGTKGARPPPPRPPATPSPLASGTPSSNSKRTCKENPFNRKASPSPATSKTRPPRGPRPARPPARPPAPGHGFPLIKRKVQSDQYIPVEDIHGEMSQLEQQLDELEQRGVELERKLRDNPNDEEEERLLVDWFTLIHEKHLLVRREAELVYTAKQQNLEERQADVEYELRCLLNKPEKEWNDEDKGREQELMADLVTIIEQRNQIINSMDLDRQREEEEDRLMAAMLKKKEFHKEPDSEQQQHQKKKGSKFKPMKVLKRLSHKGEPGKGQSPR